MTSKPTRVFTFTIALLFLFSAGALSFLVIYQSVQSHNSSNDNSKSQVQATLAGTQLQGFTPVTDVPALKKTTIKQGTGKTVKAGDTVTVDYTGAIASTGVIFQSTQDSGQPATLSLNQVIKGWQQGIPGMKVGGQYRLLIPSSLAYGAQGQPQAGIPANANLVFDITVQKID